MSATSGKVVVVGVDGSDASVEVLEFALQEGLRRGVAVEVVTAVGFESPAPGYGGPRTYAETKRLAQEKQDDVVRRAVDRLDSAPAIAQVVVEGHGADALVEAAERAEILVVGHHHRRFLARARLGSVAEGCVARTQLPVVVVPVGAPSKNHGAAGQLATSPVSSPDAAGGR